MVLSREEALRRNRESKRLYSVRNRELLKAKAKAAREANPEYNTVRKERYRAKLQELIDAGLFQPLKRGRKPLYSTPEEAMEAKRRQMKESRLRRAGSARTGRITRRRSLADDRPLRHVSCRSSRDVRGRSGAVMTPHLAKMRGLEGTLCSRGPFFFAPQA